MPIDIVEFRKQVRDFCDQEVYPIAENIDKEDTIPSGLWEKIGSVGLLGITIPENYGGRGLDYLHHVIAIEEFSRASGTVGFSYADHSNICLHNIFVHANEEQRKKYVPQLCSGEYLGALSMSEPCAGSDVVGSMSCMAEKHNGYWLANGTKKWTTNGNSADVIIVYMRTADKTKGSHSISAFLLDDSVTGWERSEKLDKLGMRGADNCELYFNDCKIPQEHLLGVENEGVRILMSGLDSERLLLSAGPIGLMQAALDLVLPYVREREQFGKPIGQFELMQAKIAEMYTSLQTARAFTYRTAEAFDNDKPSRADAAACALYASRAAVQVSLEAIQALGGIGYMNDSLASRLLRDSKIYEIGGGTNEIRKMLIGRELFQRDPEYF
ncbi:MAG: acyl-CoA dehydrogenase family protein [Ectothiorhodospiraceae bacterium]|nr:acyl-CoA dehydrogenase family protein [Ectothiorhodospiraceae bacterium]